MSDSMKTILGHASIDNMLFPSGNFWYVNSATGASDNDGTSADAPKATLAQALAISEYAAGDTIVLAEGHSETIAAVRTVSKAGVKIVGQGSGTRRPALTVSGTVDGISLEAANCSVENVRFVTPAAVATAQVNIAAADCKVLGCRFEMGANAREAITVTAAGTRAEIARNEVLVAANGPDSWVEFQGVVDRPWIHHNLVIGSDGTNVLDDGVLDFTSQAVTNPTVEWNDFNGGGQALTVIGNGGSVVAAHYGPNAYSGSAVDADNISGGAANLTTVTDALYGANGVASFPNAAWPANAVSLAEVERMIVGMLGGTAAGENGIPTWPESAAPANNVSIAEALGWLNDAVQGTAGVVTWAAGAAPANGVSISEAIRDIWDVLRNGTGGTEPGTNRSILDCIRGSAMNYGNINYLAVTADMTSATWNTAATHEVFTVTGAVRMRLMIECTATLTDAADGASIQAGVETATNGFIASTGAAGAGGNTIETGEIWCDNTPADTYGNFSSLVLDKVVAGGLDVGYEITGAALTGGTLVFHCWWEGLNATGAVAAGTGAAL